MAKPQNYNIDMIKRLIQAVADTGEVFTIEEAIEFIDKLNANDLVLINATKKDQCDSTSYLAAQDVTVQCEKKEGHDGRHSHYSTRRGNMEW